ncbi:MAG: hypothetical protein HOD63_16615 [Bacteroidetes bacterium]|jgi:hypothetical protein|nr:hypothetical protein [Bacteroidota bacterium]
MIKNLVLFLILSLILLSCKRESPISLPPHIEFKKSPAYITTDSTVAFGKLLKVGIIAEKALVNITNILIQVDTGVLVTAFDTSFNTDYFEYDYLLRKSQAEEEKWIFTIRDRDGAEKSISFVLKKSTFNDFSPILTFDSIVLKGRLNPDPKSFLSLSDFSTYTLAEAYNNQENIDIFYYYGPENHTMASPGANVEPDIFTGATPAYKFDFWAVRNTTRYKIFEVPKATFDAISNDSLLIIAYGVEEGKRKAKELVNGQVYSFADKTSRLGLFRVIDISGKDSGYIHMDMKIQE